MGRQRLSLAVVFGGSALFVATFVFVAPAMPGLNPATLDFPSSVTERVSHAGGAGAGGGGHGSGLDHHQPQQVRPSTTVTASEMARVAVRAVHVDIGLTPC